MSKLDAALECIGKLQLKPAEIISLIERLEAYLEVKGFVASKPAVSADDVEVMGVASNTIRRQRDQYKAERDAYHQDLERLLNIISKWEDISKQLSDRNRERMVSMINHVKQAQEERGGLFPAAAIALHSYNLSQSAARSSFEETEEFIINEIQERSEEPWLTTAVDQLLNIAEFGRLTGTFTQGYSVGLLVLATQGSAGLLADAILLKTEGGDLDIQLIQKFCEALPAFDFKPSTIREALLCTQDFMNSGLTQEEWAEKNNKPQRTLRKYLNIRAQVKNLRQSPDTLMPDLPNE